MSTLKKTRVVLSLLTSGLLTVSTVSTAWAQLAIDKYLQASYDFESISGNTVADASGNKRSANRTGKAKIVGDPTLANPANKAMDNTASEMAGKAQGSGGSLRYTGPSWGPLKSFTITLWYKVPAGHKIEQAARLFELSGIAPESLLLAFDKQRLAVNLGTKQLGRHGTERPLLFEEDRWIFVAMAYDGNYEENNLRVYIGSEDGALEHILLASAKEPLWNQPAANLTLAFGATVINSRSMAAWFDDIRIYGSPDGTEGALLLPEVREVLRSRIVPAK